jgi:thiol-disulfide isomerase/thioredoxin
MRYFPLVVFAFLILSVPGTGFCAGSPSDNGINASRNPDYWIHLDPVPDKHLNDTFVITGSTNIHAGESVKIGIYSTLFDLRRDPPPRWYREDTVVISRGKEGNNTFTTPFITPLNDITKPQFHDGRHETVWIEGEYYIVAEGHGDTLVTASAVFTILPNVTSPGVTPAPVVLDDDRVVWFFYGEECPHCHEVMPFIDTMTEKYPDARVRRLEIYHNTTNQQIYAAVNAAAGIPSPRGVPEVVIGNVTLVGIKEIREQMEDYLQFPAQGAGNRPLVDNSSTSFEGKSFTSSFLLFLLLLLLGAAGAAYLVVLYKKP